MAQSRWRTYVVFRLLVALLLGILVTVLIGTAGSWTYAPSAGWITTASVYLAWTWIVVLPMDADRTRDHVRPEDPPRGWATDMIVLLASVASLAGVAQLLTAGSKAGVEKSAGAAVGVLSIVAAWCVVHTVFSLRYADVFYKDPEGGIRFDGEQDARFMDFFYLGFTIGMTYQVSDTRLQSAQMRRTALGHALLSYVLGAIILAATVNLIVELGNPTH